MRRSAITACFLILATVVFAQELPNPFTSHNAKPRSGLLKQATSGLYAFLFSLMAPVQKTLNESLVRMTRALEGSRSAAGFLLVIAFSLAYGIFHAAGPGHGKTIVSSFFLANDGKPRHSFIIGYLIAGVHTVSALTVVLVLYYLIRGIISTGVEQTNRYIQVITFAAITVIGGVMLVRRAMGKGHHHHGHPHDHEHEGAHDNGLTMRNMLGIAVPAGAIPCPGAVAVILFALSLHMLGISVLAVSSISLGMGTTIAVTGVIAILAKRGAIRAIAVGHEQRGALIRTIVEIAGAAILFLFGLILFLAQI